MSRESVVNQISSDLKISSFNGEAKERYISRIVYSALSMWLRVSTLDKSIFEQEDHLGVSKAHMRSRCKPFLDQMITLYPEIQGWFYPKEDLNPIKIIQKRLYDAGEFVNVDFNNNVGLPVYAECRISKRIGVIRGLNSTSFSNVTGLIQMKKLNVVEDIDPAILLSFYSIKDQSANIVAAEYIRQAKWFKVNELKASQVFDKYHQGPLTNGWKNVKMLKENECSIYRHNNYLYNRDFGFVRRINGHIYTSQINRYLIDQNEVRRFIYGLKSEIRNAEVARFRKHIEGGIIELNLSSSLPKQEEAILLLMGWPSKNIDDKYNLLFRSPVWSLIKTILINLNIELEEVV